MQPGSHQGRLDAKHRTSERRPRGETRYARCASSARTIAARMMNEARFARRPALLRFSAAHKARPRPTARPFADTVVVFVTESLVYVSSAANVS